MGFTLEETEELRKLWEWETECPHEIDSSASLPSSSNEYLSSDSVYLKHLLSKPLAHALRDIVTRKPFDPVEYLGHWLLNYKICEERETRKKEFELELMIERERTKLQKGEEEEVSVLSQGEEEEEEEEGFFDDWTFVNDEELEIS
ncbi:DPY30 domain-containing protein 2-like [Bombus impatiens]|uniref:DPY30 domain-containing protein 2-like n=1 Tax=Bombus impatiens TaxID=132113 RepID=A0A6P3UYF0_BOMIM|nr:DPY30 domain-containing protein 2-like [Bombus impatiens]